jgi:hypothetical protein
MVPLRRFSLVASLVRFNCRRFINRTGERLADEDDVSRGLSPSRSDIFAGPAGLRIQVKIRRPHQPSGRVLSFLQSADGGEFASQIVLKMMQQSRKFQTDCSSDRKQSLQFHEGAMMVAFFGPDEDTTHADIELDGMYERRVSAALCDPACLVVKRLAGLDVPFFTQNSADGKPGPLQRCTMTASEYPWPRPPSPQSKVFR